MMPAFVDITGLVKMTVNRGARGMGADVGVRNVVTVLEIKGMVQ